MHEPVEVDNVRLWQKQARTLGGDDLVDALESMADDIAEIKRTLSRAFVGGDADGHRRYHELVQERNAELRRLRIAIQEKTISALIWSIIVGISIAVWHEIVSVVGRH